MTEINPSHLTDRQRRELEYHQEHAEENRQLLNKPFAWDVIINPRKKWWNAYWQMFTFLMDTGLTGKKVLVVGTGFGDDAIRIAKLGAIVSAFDLSEDSLSIARELAKREGLSISFQQMQAESLLYPNDSFDVIVARDILHHVDIPLAMKEIVRVAKKDGILVINEIYSHSITDYIRQSWFVAKILYPRMRSIIYGKGKPYITKDERKLSEHDLSVIFEPLGPPIFIKHFNFIATRILPGRVDFFAKLDRVFIFLLRPFSAYIAGRILFAARIHK